MRKLPPNQCRHHTTTLPNDITTLQLPITLQPSRCFDIIKLQSNLQLIIIRLIIIPSPKYHHNISSLKYSIAVPLVIPTNTSLSQNYFTTTTDISLPSCTIIEIDSYYHFLTLLKPKRHSPLTHKLSLVLLLWEMIITEYYLSHHKIDTPPPSHYYHHTIDT